MAEFAKQSEQRLMQAHPDLITLFRTVVKKFDCIVLESFRDKEKQDEAFKNGNSKLQWPHGKHNQLPSLAVDVAPYPLDWKDLSRFYHFAGFVQGTAEMLLQDHKITHKIRWGGDWDSDQNLSEEKFKDLVHFEVITE